MQVGVALEPVGAGRGNGSAGWRLDLQFMVKLLCVSSLEEDGERVEEENMLFLETYKKKIKDFLESCKKD
jgi:hypothetical protein